MKPHCWTRLRRHTFIGTAEARVANCVYCGGDHQPVECGWTYQPVVCTECGRRTEKWTLR